MYYALGGGLGHLTRAQAVIHTLALKDILVLTASTWANELAWPAGVHIIAPPPKLETNRSGFQSWLSELFTQYTPSAIYLDSFPHGIQGELPATEIPLIYLARYLRWPRYQQLSNRATRPLHQTWLLEPLDTHHQTWIETHSTQINQLELVDPPANAPPWFEQFYTSTISAAHPLWLIVHSGAAHELAQLIEWAESAAELSNTAAHLGLVTPQPPTVQPTTLAWSHLPLQPAWPCFAYAQQIFSGLGFNIARQTAAYRTKHHWLPFPRTFDDQWQRGFHLRQALSKIQPNHP